MLKVSRLFCIPQRCKMIFRFQNYIAQQVSRQAGWSLLSAGLVRAGIGFAVIVFQPIFIFLVAGIFFLAAGTCTIWAIRLLIVAYLYKKADETEQQDEPFRENVRVHDGNDYIDAE